MSIRTIDTVLTQQALITGRVEDRVTGRSLDQLPSVALVVRAGPGRSGRRIPLSARVLSGSQFVFAGDPATALPIGATLDLRLVTRAVGYHETHLDISLDASQLTPIEEVWDIGGSTVTTERLLAPLADPVIQMTPMPVSLAGSVVEADDPGVPVANARVRVNGIEGIRLAGRLHYSHDVGPVSVQDETDGLEIEVLHDLAAGASSLPHGTAGTFSAGDVLRIRTDPGETEYVTITSDNRPDFREPGLTFAHRRDTTTLHHVTLTDRAGEPAGGLGQPSPLGAAVIEVIEVASVTGLARGQVVRIGDGATREYHIVVDAEPFGPVETSERGFFTLRDVPIRPAIDIAVEHDDFTALETPVGLDFRQMVNERVFSLTV